MEEVENRTGEDELKKMSDEEYSEIEEKGHDSFISKSHKKGQFKRGKDQQQLVLLRD